MKALLKETTGLLCPTRRRVRRAALGKYALVAGLAVLTGVGLAACGGRRAVEKQAPKDTEPYRLEQEGTIPALDSADIRREADREAVPEEMPVADAPLEVRDVAPVQPLPPDTVESPGYVTQRGYRVQVFASAKSGGAESVRYEAESKLGVPAYVELDGGIYKVRVGNCRSRAEAETLLAKCRQAGYGDAWIVQTEVLVKKIEPGRNG